MPEKNGSSRSGRQQSTVNCQLSTESLTPFAGLQRAFARDGIAVTTSDRDVTRYALPDGFELLRADTSAAGAALFGDPDHRDRIDALASSAAALERCKTERKGGLVRRCRDFQEGITQTLFDRRAVRDARLG